MRCKYGTKEWWFCGLEASHKGKHYSEMTALLEEIERLRDRCRLYNEAVTILLECDHGDAVCGCRDRAMESGW